MLIVGSRALNFHFPDYRKTIDWDFIGSEQEVKKWFDDKKLFPTIIDYKNATVYLITINEIDFEFEIATKGTSSFEYLEYLKNKEYSLEYASLEVLYSLKKSHINHPLCLEKHLSDFEFLKSMFDKDNLEHITNKRISETNNRFC